MQTYFFPKKTYIIYYTFCFLEFSRILQDFLEFSRIFQNFLEFSRIFQNFLEFSKIFQDFPYVYIYQKVYVYDEKMFLKFMAFSVSYSFVFRAAKLHDKINTTLFPFLQSLPFFYFVHYFSLILAHLEHFHVLNSGKWHKN